MENKKTSKQLRELPKLLREIPTIINTAINDAEIIQSEFNYGAAKIAYLKKIREDFGIPTFEVDYSYFGDDSDFEEEDDDEEE